MSKFSDEEWKEWFSGLTIMKKVEYIDHIHRTLLDISQDREKELIDFCHTLKDCPKTNEIDTIIDFIIEKLKLVEVYKLWDLSREDEDDMVPTIVKVLSK